MAASERKLRCFPFEDHVSSKISVRELSSALSSPSLPLPTTYHLEQSNRIHSQTVQRLSERKGSSRSNGQKQEVSIPWLVTWMALALFHQTFPVAGFPAPQNSSGPSGSGNNEPVIQIQSNVIHTTFAAGSSLSTIQDNHQHNHHIEPTRKSIHFPFQHLHLRNKRSVYSQIPPPPPPNLPPLSGSKRRLSNTLTSGGSLNQPNVPNHNGRLVSWNSSSSSSSGSSSTTATSAAGASTTPSATQQFVEAEQANPNYWINDRYHEGYVCLLAQFMATIRIRPANTTFQGGLFHVSPEDSLGRRANCERNSRNMFWKFAQHSERIVGGDDGDSDDDSSGDGNDDGESSEDDQEVEEGDDEFEEIQKGTRSKSPPKRANFMVGVPDDLLPKSMLKSTRKSSRSQGKFNVNPRPSSSKLPSGPKVITIHKTNKLLSVGFHVVGSVIEFHVAYIECLQVADKNLDTGRFYVHPGGAACTNLSVSFDLGSFGDRMGYECNYMLGKCPGGVRRIQYPSQARSRCRVSSRSGISPQKTEFRFARYRFDE